MWPRAMGKTHAIKTFMGMDIATNDSVSVNQFVFMDSKGRIQIITGEKDMCYDGQAPETPYERDLRAEVKELQRNHLGAATERFIQMAKENGKNEHLSSYTHQLEQELYQTRQELERAVEQVAYSDNETQKANKRAQNWETNYYSLARKHENLLAKNRKAKAPVKKTSKK